jgi:hypothetical protein
MEFYGMCDKCQALLGTMLCDNWSGSSSSSSAAGSSG